MNVKDIQTPFFLLNRKVMADEVAKLKKAISAHWASTIVAYSVKTNSLPYLAKMLKEMGVFAEVVSQDEYEMVRLCGYDHSNLVCNGPIKSQAFVSDLMDHDAILNIDSHAELSYAIAHASSNSDRKYKVGIRVNVDVEKYFPSESKAGEQGSRFGFCMENEELSDAITKLRTCDNIFINGLHLHVSTSTRKVKIYEWLSRLFSDIVKKYELCDIEYFDIGGGFFGGMPNLPGWNEYLETISKVLKDSGFNSDSLKIILEPGVSLLAGAFSYYASVVDVKQTNRSRFVVTDGSRTHIDPFFHKTNYFYEYLPKDSSGSKFLAKQIVVGFTCLEYDNIMTIEDSVEIQVGDIFRFDKLGAYTLSLSPLFISYFPAVYVQNEEDSFQCVRNRWTAKEFVQSSNI